MCIIVFVGLGGVPTCNSKDRVPGGPKEGFDIIVDDRNRAVIAVYRDASIKVWYFIFIPLCSHFNLRLVCESHKKRPTYLLSANTLVSQDYSTMDRHDTSDGVVLIADVMGPLDK